MMNDIFDTINNVIQPQLFTQPTAGRLVLQDSTGKPIEVKKTGKVACLEFDKQGLIPFPYFNQGVKGLCSVADRIIFYAKDDNLFVFIVELKTKNTSGAMWQVNASYELAKFVSNTILRMLNYKNITIKYRGLIFADRTIKGTSRPKNLNYQIHPHSNLKFKSLQSGFPIQLDTLTY